MDCARPRRSALVVEKPAMKIKAFDALVLRKMQPEIEAALAAPGRKHGITIRAGTARFRERTAELKLGLAVIGGDGKSARKEAEELVLSAFGAKAQYLVDPEQGRSATLCVFAPKADRTF